MNKYIREILGGACPNDVVKGLFESDAQLRVLYRKWLNSGDKLTRDAMMSALARMGATEAREIEAKVNREFRGGPINPVMLVSKYRTSLAYQPNYFWASFYERNTDGSEPPMRFPDWKDSELREFYDRLTFEIRIDPDGRRRATVRDHVYKAEGRIQAAERGLKKAMPGYEIFWSRGQGWDKPGKYIQRAR